MLGFAGSVEDRIVGSVDTLRGSWGIVPMVEDRIPVSGNVENAGTIFLRIFPVCDPQKCRSDYGAPFVPKLILQMHR